METKEATVITALATEDFVKSEINKVKRNIGSSATNISKDNITITDKLSGKPINIFFKEGLLISEYNYEPIMLDSDDSSQFEILDENDEPITDKIDGQVVVGKSIPIMDSETGLIFKIKLPSTISPSSSTPYFKQITYPASWAMDEAGEDNITIGSWVEDHWEQNIVKGDNMTVSYDSNLRCYQIEINRECFKLDRKCVLKFVL